VRGSALDTYPDVAGVILAGGRSRRLGHDKAFERVGGQPLIERVIFSLSFLDTLLVVTTSRRLPGLAAQLAGVRVVADIKPGLGPLGGIYTGLLSTEASYVLVAGCDMPFLQPRLLKYMLQFRCQFQAVVPRISGLTEPLHAVYSRDCLPVIERYLKGERPKVSDTLGALKVRYVEDVEISALDPEHLSFFNINSAADLHRAVELARKMTSAQGPAEVK